MSKFIISFLPLTLIFLVSCSSIGTERWDSAMSDSVKERSAFEFDCSKNDIKVNKLTNKSYGASGCGKKGTYMISGPVHCTPDLFHGDEKLVKDICPVILNTDIKNK